MRSLAVAGLIFCWAILPARADYYEGLAAYKRGDFEAAAREWQPLARGGQAEAQFQIGRLYRHGEGLPQDDAKAAEWYRKAAEQGHARAQNNLGVLHTEGRGVPQDEAQAADWYRKAAEQGRAVAQKNLARLYDEGRGLAEDPDAAAQWYRRAGDRGHPEAQTRLAEMYEAGRGVAQDPAKAAKWYRKAARLGYAEAQSRLGQMYAEGIGVSRDRKKALGWLLEAAEQGDEAARRSLDRLREPRPEPAGLAAAAPEAQPAEPAAVIPDTGEALSHQEATAVDVAPQPVEAPIVAPGPSPPPAAEPEAPSSWGEPRRLAEAGDPEAQYRLGRTYATGEGALRSGTRAEQWYRRAAEQGHVMAAYELAFLYLRGRSGTGDKDFVRAHLWFHVAAKAEVGDAGQWLERIRGKMSDRELAQAEAQLNEWKQSR